VVRTGQNPANQKHTAACQAGDLSFSASHLSEQMATQHTFHIRLLHGGDRQTRFKHSMPGDVAGACQNARLLFVQTGKNCSLHLQSPTRSSTENILSLISIHAASVSSRLGSRTESRVQPSVHRCGDQDTSNNNSAVALLRPPNVTIHCRDVGPDLGGQYWGRRDRGRAPLGEQSGPDFYTTLVVTKIKVWSPLRDTALTSRVSLLARSLNQ
jgi:hypothetical protein